MMAYQLHKQHLGSGTSSINADKEMNAYDVAKLRCDEDDKTGSTHGFFLGPGLGFIDSVSLKRLISFHGYLTAGAFIGMQMLILGKRFLEVDEAERLHVICETVNCLPDPFQILAGCTTGSKGLIIRDTGKMAVTITRHSPPGESTLGVRILLDVKKAQKYEKLYAWYLNTLKVPHKEIVEILREAGDTVYSYEYVRVNVPEKKKKCVAVCSICGEAFIRKDEKKDCCMNCAKEREG